MGLVLGLKALALRPPRNPITTAGRILPQDGVASQWQAGAERANSGKVQDLTRLVVEVWYAQVVLQTLRHWPLAHPVLFPIGLFVLASLVSVYSEDIKIFLHSWPHTKRIVRSLRENITGYNLDLLQRLHENSYQLLLYLALKITMNFLFAVALNAVVSMVVAIMKTQVEHGAAAIFVGAFFGMCLEVSTVLWQLGRYEKSIAKLHKRLSEFQQE